MLLEIQWPESWTSHLALIHQILIKRLACLLNKEPMCLPASCVQWCQSPILSDQVLLDILHEESLMFNIKYTYLKIFDITWDFDLTKWYSNMLKSQHKRNIVIAIYGWVTIQTWFPLLVPICSPSWHRVSPVVGKEYVGKSQLKPVSLFKVPLINCPVFILYVGVIHVYISPSPHAGLAGSGSYYSLLIISGKAVYTTCRPTGTALYLQQRLPSSPPCVEISSAFSTVTGGHSLPSSLSSSFLPISSESSSIVGLCWLSQVER